MKRLRLLPLLAVVTACVLAARWPASASVATEDEEKVYGIAFYNLENLFDTINQSGKFDLEFTPGGARGWDTEKYQAKLEKLAAAIHAMSDERTPDGPAIIGIAEVENESVVRDLVNTAPLSERGLKYVHHDSPDKRGIDVALLYDPAQFEVTGVLNAPLTTIDFATRDQMAVTGVLGGDTLTVIVNHWPSRLGGEEQSRPNRVKAAELSKQIAQTLWQERPGQHVIIMGDLNDDPSSYSVAVTLAADANPGKVKNHSFYNPWWEIWDEDTRGTLSYRGKWNLFDQILVSGTLLDNKKGAPTGNLLYDSARINDFDFLKNPPDSRYAGTPLRTHASGKWLNGYSDHFPTEIFLIAK
ncbi:MAG: endonuclease/exonuclease/phosphatase family protein [Muribaculaceae bacterium]|nr:endonuclease/exonuclease/phosphatase family protein [Muribaculaceae bacterium]